MNKFHICGGVIIKTLAVYYSKTGTTKKIADAIVKALGCDVDELKYDETSKTVQSSRNPSGYEHIILLSPIWAFSLSEPMKLHLAKHKSGISDYSLIVTCSLFGLGGCKSFCQSEIGKPPKFAVKFKSKAVKEGRFDLNNVISELKKP